MYRRWLYALKSGEATTEYRNVALPSLFIEDSRPDMEWLMRFYTFDKNGGRWRIVQAKEQNRFAMGPNGLSVVAAFAAAVSLECMIYAKEFAADTYVFDHAGSLALTKNGYNFPLLVGNFGHDEFMVKDVNVEELNW